MWRKRIILAYLLLLAASHLVRWMRPAPESLRPGQQSISLPAIDNGVPTATPINLAYWEFPAASPDAPVVVMLHGSPGSSNQVTRLGKSLAGPNRVIVPDLPGFGASTPRIPDYSIAAHARYLEALLERLEIQKAHLLGFSLGGGVALEYADIAPDKTASVILIGSIGVQELELLGDHLLNHAVHGFQLGALWFIHEGIPHFGLLDNSMLDIPYARNFFDSDQRPLRQILNNLQSPTLILHGKSDFLVPVSAAREHARIVPQSELILYEDGHFRVFTNPASLHNPIADFIHRVDTGSATTRATALPDRIAAARVPFNWETHGHPRPISLPTLSLLLALATWITEDLTCISAGILVSKGAIPFTVATFACFLGIFSGDFLVYLAGKALGRRALRRAPLRWLISDYQVDRSAHFFHVHGPKLILTTRFIPGTRLPTYFTAGLLGTGFWRFSGWFLLAVAIWTPLLVGLAALVGGRMLDWFQRFDEYALIGLVAVILFLLLLLKIVVPLSNHRGRRFLLSAWRRKTRWEFWPLWAVYPPVVLYILALGVRHRCLTLFTAANPAIPAGGLADESKSRILDGFRKTASATAERDARGGADSPEIASYRLIPRHLNTNEKISAIDDFIRLHNLSFPLVLKPDAGERGEGVAVIRNHAEAESYVGKCPLDIIAQEFVSGDEFGIFYFRRPGEERGRIFSITDKRLPKITGDGARSIEELILDDDRAVCMAPFFLKKFSARLDEIPATDEVVPLTELGTHSRGAIFLDGADLLTEELEDAIDSLSKRYDGFFFGRYDIRAASREDLRNGRKLKVLELNGVTSEATHIYDPSHSLFYAWRTLMRQWKIAFDIGALNAKNGVTPSSPGEVLALVQRFRHRKRFEV